jgi:glycosyltransferase involved in cell wall biosynthesis
MEKKKPFFSIIVPTFNRPDKLSDCLESLTHLDYPQNCFQVVVVDDGSKVTPESVVSRFLNHLDVTLLMQTHVGPASARNRGAKKAKGEFLVFTDDDCYPAPDWLNTLATHFLTRPDHAVGGQTLNVLTDNPYSTASQWVINYLFTYYNADPHHARFFTSNNLALPADRFHFIGGFNTNFPQAAGEDREFCERWLHQGYRMIYAPEALVYHAHPLTLSTFCLQHFNYGRGGFRFYQLRASRNRQRFKTEPLLFYLNILRYPLSQTQGMKRFSLLVLLFISQLANAAGLLRERFHNVSGLPLPFSSPPQSH